MLTCSDVDRVDKFCQLIIDVSCDQFKGCTVYDLCMYQEICQAAVLFCFYLKRLLLQSQFNVRYKNKFMFYYAYSFKDERTHFYLNLFSTSNL